ncbi:hypothetical protein D3C78_1284260 [compost metagenome]
MHGTAFTTAKPGFLSIDFRHHAVEIAALGNAVPMPPVGRANVVLIGQVFAHPYGNSFLTGIQMQKTWDLARGVFHMQAFFKLTDFPHFAVGLE